MFFVRRLVSILVSSFELVSIFSRYNGLSIKKKCFLYLNKINTFFQTISCLANVRFFVHTYSAIFLKQKPTITAVLTMIHPFIFSSHHNLSRRHQHLLIFLPVSSHTYTLFHLEPSSWISLLLPPFQGETKLLFY